MSKHLDTEAFMKAIEDAFSHREFKNILAIWKSCQQADWGNLPNIHRILAEKFVKLGEPLVAFEVATAGLSIAPTDLRLRQLLALALARSGATESASSVVGKLCDEGAQDEETLGLMARIWKDLALQTVDAFDRRKNLDVAAQFYERAFRLSGGYWTGINAATIKLILGERNEAHDLAREVSRLCLVELKRTVESSADHYWPLATLGEASLILGHNSEALMWYSRAVEIGAGRYGDFATSIKNLRIMHDHLGLDITGIQSAFRIPAVVVFSGHMIDRPNRPRSRFPEELVDRVRTSLRERLTQLNVGFGFSSAACGSDILFLECVPELGGETHIVLPCEKSEFIRQSIDIALNDSWRGRFEEVLQRATTTVVASNQNSTLGGKSFEYANQLLLGLASMRAAQLDAPFTPVAVWDRIDDDTVGGTASTVKYWQRQGHNVEIIDLSEFLRTGAGTPSVIAQSSVGLPETSNNGANASVEIRSLLFADAVGFSKIEERQIPLFVDHFLGLVAKLIDECPVAPLLKNTWGDGLYFVFHDVHAAGTFAIELCERVRAEKWIDKGLADVNLRIGLHAGPVYSCFDPVLGRTNYVGSHVSQAARIEPVTPPGYVYASQAFAALAAAQKVKEFRCEYVGQTALAKNYGTMPTYIVRRVGRSVK